MRHDRLAGLAAGTAVVAVAATASWGFVVRPELALRWLFIGALIPFAWLYVEVAQTRGRDEQVGREIMTMLRACIAWAGLMISVKLALRLGVHTGVLDEDWIEPGKRLVGLLLGMGMVLYGNSLPTLRSPWPHALQPFAWQQVHRFVGWTVTVAGLGVLGAWLWASAAVASRTTTMLVSTAVVLSLVRKLVSVFVHGDRPPID